VNTPGPVQHGQPELLRHKGGRVETEVRRLGGAMRIDPVLTADMRQAAHASSSAAHPGPCRQPGTRSGSPCPTIPRPCCCQPGCSWPQRRTRSPRRCSARRYPPRASPSGCNRPRSWATSAACSSGARCRAISWTGAALAHPVRKCRCSIAVRQAGPAPPVGPVEVGPLVCLEAYPVAEVALREEQALRDEELLHLGLLK
jgi:hypothetical protein